MSSMREKMWRLGNSVAVSLYRRSGGRIGGKIRGAKVLLLTVPGRRTGTPHTVPVSYVEHGGGYLVAGSAGGQPEDPQWFRNLREVDGATVEIGSTRMTVRPTVLTGAERDEAWRDVIVAQLPFFAGYEEKSGRSIPVAVLRQEP